MNMRAREALGRGIEALRIEHGRSVRRGRLQGWGGIGAMDWKGRVEELVQEMMNSRGGTIGKNGRGGCRDSTTRTGWKRVAGLPEFPRGHRVTDRRQPGGGAVVSLRMLRRT